MLLGKCGWSSTILQSLGFCMKLKQIINYDRFITPYVVVYGWLLKMLNLITKGYFAVVVYIFQL